MPSIPEAPRPHFSHAHMLLGPNLSHSAQVESSKADRRLVNGPGITYVGDALSIESERWFTFTCQHMGFNSFVHKLCSQADWEVHFSQLCCQVLRSHLRYWIRPKQFYILRACIFFGHARNTHSFLFGKLHRVHLQATVSTYLTATTATLRFGFAFGVAWKMPTKPNWAYGKMALTKNCVRALMCAGFPAIMSLPQPAISHLSLSCRIDPKNSKSLDLTQSLQDPSRWLLCPAVSSTVQSHHLRVNSSYI